MKKKKKRKSCSIALYYSKNPLPNIYDNFWQVHKKDPVIGMSVSFTEYKGTTAHLCSRALAAEG